MILKCIPMIFFSALIIFCADAQEIDNTATWKNINADGYIRLTVDNDIFTGTDDQYTEGMNLELCMPWVRKFQLSRLLVHPHYGHIRYGIGVEQAGYTPYELQRDGVPLKDRPYSGTLFVKTFLIATDTQKKQWFATTLSTGVIGPASDAQRLQDGVHSLIQNTDPPGWKYQVQNDVILNYQVNYEKQLFALGKFMLADGSATARAGTLSDKAGVGFNLMAGYFESPFSNIHKFNTFRIYVFDNPEIDVVGYDATLEGGLFDRNSPYVLPASAITPVQFLNRCGLAIAGNRFYLAYDEYYLTPQFANGPVHRWGTLQFAIAFNDGPGFKKK